MAMGLVLTLIAACSDSGDETVCETVVIPSEECDVGMKCGNGTLDDGEQCDDQNLAPGDGCSASCGSESKWFCEGEPSVCFDAGKTPSYSTYATPMAQLVELGPVQVTGSAVVVFEALEQAGIMMAMMLRERPDVAETLRAEGVLTAVFARTEQVCDLPYFADLIGMPPCDAAGGLGGVPGREATACSEKNLLQLANDEYGRGSRDDGENVCLHELAHTIMNIGLTESERARIRARYQAAKGEGLWAGDYAMENADEFFAEMSQSYFCANPGVPSFLHTHGINCAEALEDYDPDTHALIDDIYKRPADLR